jgi:hypothetical protein
MTAFVRRDIAKFQDLHGRWIEIPESSAFTVQR